MFNINKGTRGQSAKSRMNHKKLITDILSFFLSTRFRLVFIIAVMSIISTISAVKAVKYSYTTSLVEARKAYVNNEAVLIAAEFTKYGSIDEAHNDGVYENLMNYSSLNAIRIRLVDKKYNISVDTCKLRPHPPSLRSATFPRWGRLFAFYCFSSGSATGTPRCSTGVEKTICVRVRPNCCRWLMN